MRCSGRAGGIGDQLLQERRHFLEVISDECMRLTRMVDDLLDVQRLESGRGSWNVGEHDLAETVRACAETFEPIARANTIQFTVDCPLSLPIAGSTFTDSGSGTVHGAPQSCYALTLTHTGNGSTPTASPSNSAGCPTGQYVFGEVVNLSGASADAGWQINSWYGTNNDATTANTNSLTMPANVFSAARAPLRCDDRPRGW